MESKNLLTLAITLTVGIILAGSLLMPVLSDATATERTYENEGYFYLDKYEDDLTFEWDAAEPDTFTINGEDVTYHNTSGLSVSIVLGENFAIRLPDGNTAINFYGGGTFINTNSTYPTFTLTYSSGTVSATNGNSTKTISSVTECYAISNGGDYVMKKADATAYLNSGSEIVADSEIYASGQSYSGASNIFWHMAGTIEDINYPDTFNSNITITNEEIHGKYSIVCDDLYELDKFTFTATVSYQSGVTYNITASYFVVPAKVTAELSQHLAPGEIAILNALPILIITALVVMAAGALYLKRDD